MYVIKRSGETQLVSFDKVLKRISTLSTGLHNVNVFELSKKICTQISDRVPTSQLDNYAANLCSSLTVEHYEYEELAKRIAVSNLHKSTKTKFSEAMEVLYGYSIVSDDFMKVVRQNAELLDSEIDHEADYKFTFFGFRTLCRSYLQKIIDTDEIVERPQYMFMRVAIGIHYADLSQVLATYRGMKDKLFTHATPTLFNSGTRHAQCSSCFLLGIDDSIDGIFETLQKSALISKYAGGLGLHISNIRCQNSRIYGTNGLSSGIKDMLPLFNETMAYVDQSRKRKGSMCVYLEMWHGDILTFLKVRRNTNPELERFRNLFYALWISDLFFERVVRNETWSLMCPNVSRGLTDVHGPAFNELYTRYEREGKFVAQIPARELWVQVLNSQIETGMPFLLAKDSANKLANLQLHGTIKSSNLCTEIIQHSDYGREIAVCNLASLCLPSFMKENQFDYDLLRKIVAQIVRNNNKIIMSNYYSVPEARNSNLTHRPMGIGVQGLADLLIMMRLPFESPEARQINTRIFENIYYAAVDESCRLVESGRMSRFGTWDESMFARGKLHPDLWNMHRRKKGDVFVTPEAQFYGDLDWEGLRRRVVAHGTANSLFVAPMPTASTSQIMGFTESFEPVTSNIYQRKTLAGEYVVINKQLIRDLEHLGLWSQHMRDLILANEGSIQNIFEIPKEVRDLYKTVWEIPQRALIDMAVSRAPFVDQSQSMNLYIPNQDQNRMSAMYLYAWENNLKTLCYYLRSKTKAKAQKVTVPTCTLDSCSACTS